MNTFTQHNPDTAPAEAAMVLKGAKEKYGFVPNLAAYIAEAPIVLGSVLKLSEQFENSSLSAQEQQIILITVSALNGCSYCKVAHTALGKKAEVNSEILKAAISCRQISDPKLEALRTFTSTLVTEKGWAKPEDVATFLSAGFSKAQVFEVVLGVALKTLTNYCNHLAGAEPNEEFLMMTSDIID